MSTLRDLHGQYFDLIDTAEKGIRRRMRHIRDRADFLKIVTDRPYRLEFDLDALVAPVLRKFVELKNASAPASLETAERRFDRLQEVVKPIINRLKEIDSHVTAAAEEAGAVYFSNARAKEAKSFSEKKETNAPAPQATGKTKKEKTQMAKTRKFQEGAWVELETDDADLAEQIKIYMAENPGVDYVTAAVKCQKEAIGADPEKRFSESAASDGVPAEAVEKLKSARRAVAVKISNGSSWMKILQSGAERIVPVNTEGAEDFAAFQDERNFSGGRFVRPANKKPGHSADGKTFTNHAGRTLQVDDDRDFSDAVELETFMMRFANEISEVWPKSVGREAIAKKAMNILFASGRNPITSNTDDVRIALRAAVAKPEKFNDALRYAASIETFGSFKKAIEVALA